ncbi:unnamed protein product [Paramecium sonneborni]|uniref:Transmembrane protein n=1 Tax=Paramecium sonneborni TaxID=65129 RepID=A0A8S1MH37_9CILI|nr:unnamed protein product [Paramecium sonneborni]
MGIMKYFSKLIYFFLRIGTNTERRKAQIDYGNQGMIVFYFIQLLGYYFSQFESKSLIYYENDYLAQIGQYSSIPFMMIVIHYDPLTKFVYYCIFGTMCFIYAAVIFQITFKPISPNNFLNRFIRFYFKNFQWYFLTPFHECMIGVLTCGRLSYLAQHSNLDPQQCFSQISPHFLVLSIIGQVLVILSGCLSLYCFRNYEFVQGDLMRKFSYFNLVTIILHMALQISSFWKEMYDHYNILIHLVFNFIAIFIALDIYINIPFGFSQETIFFSKCLLSTWFFEILVAIWIFSDLNDAHIFLTFCISVPLIFGINQALYDNYIDKECQLYFNSNSNKISEHPLEFICQLCHLDNLHQKDYYLILKYLSIHCQKCNDLNCPCKSRLNKFIIGQNQLNTQQIYIWVQYQFQKMIKQIVQNPNSLKYFEQLTIKFVTFLQRYRENSVLSYKIIQDVVYTFKKIYQTNMPYFFINLTKQIQHQNKIEIENNNRSGIQIGSLEFRTLQDFNLFYNFEDEIVKSMVDLLECLKTLWFQKMNHLTSYEKMIQFSEQIRKKTQLVKKEFKNFQAQREIPAIDSILILRIKLAVSIVCMEDINTCLKIAQQIEYQVKEQSNSKSQQFNNLQFINGQALSIVSNVQSQTLGYITQNINDQFFGFFGYQNINIPLTKIEQLLPIKLGKIHNGLIESYLQQGKTNRLYANSEQFILNADNLIEKVNICLTALFPYSNDQFWFWIIGHLLKTIKYEKQEIDQSKRGYILVDSDFLIFGITRNIYERINYKYYYKNNTNIDLILPEEIYEQITIQELIPALASILEEYYRLLTIKNEKRIFKQDIICQREIGVLQVPQQKRTQFKTSSSLTTKKYTSKQILNNLKDVNISISNIKPKHTKLYPIEFSVVQKVLSYLAKDSASEFLYFVIEIDFLEDPKLYSSPSQQNAKTPALSDILRRQQAILEQVRPDQNNVILSNDGEDVNEQIELVAEMTNTATKHSSNEINEQLEKIIVYMNDTILPKTIKNLIAQFLLQILVLIIIIILISNLFQHKKNIQSNCIQQITADLNFLDAYSQTMSGSRHVIYYRDFYPIQNDTIIPFNSDQINISRYDKIYIAWQHIAKGSVRLIDMYLNYSKIAQNSDIQFITIYFINFDLKSKISQTVYDYSTYYQIMHQIFFMSYQSFASSPQTYLSGRNDSYMTQIARSQVYYNFFDVSESVNITLEDCHNYNIEMNDHFDQIVNYYFVGIYLTIILQLITLIINYLKVVHTIKLYLKLFKMLDKEDCVQILHLCDQLINMVSYNRIFLRQKDFKLILTLPQYILDDVRKSQNKTTVIFVKKKRTNDKQVQVNSNYQNYCSIAIIFFFSTITLAYVFSFHLYYSQIANSIGPISNRAILAQEHRLNFIVTSNRFDLFLIKQYFETYALINQSDPGHQLMTRNIQTDTSILNLLNLDEELIKQDISRLKMIDFTSLILKNEQSNSEINDEQQNQLLGQDVCLLTGCDMQSLLFYDRLHQKELIPFFQTGVVNLQSKVLSFVEGASQLIFKKNQTYLQKALALESILDDSEYLIYILWGIDVIQFQISQFSQYFLDISQQTIDRLTSHNQAFILLIGILMCILVLTFQILFGYYQFKRYVLSKAIIKSIPLPILFSRNIPKHLESFRRKYVK